MTLLYLTCGALLVFSALFYLKPGGKRRGAANEDLARANLEWFRLRQQELAEEGNDSLAADAQLRLLEDEQDQPLEQEASANQAKFPVWILAPLVAVFSIALYYKLGAADDVLVGLPYK